MYTRIGPYQPLKKLATGGMADVFLARPFSNGTDLCALKVLLAELTDNIHISEHFADEAIILQSLEHPSIIRWTTDGTDFERPYFVMEYVHGVSGSELMFEAHQAKRNVPLGLALGIIKSISEALEHGYNELLSGMPRQVVHNDVSPHNFQIGFDGTIKLLDYGVAIRRQEMLPKSRRGKFAYMSPEGIRGDALDHRSDLFSLGVSLYEMVLHKRAFKAKTPEETMQRILSGDVKRPSDYAPSFPKLLETIIMKSIAIDPSQRFQSGKALADGIDAFASSHNLDLSQASQKTRIHELLGSLIQERARELELLSTSELPDNDDGQLSSPPPNEVQNTDIHTHSELAPAEPEVEIVMMELPTWPLKFLLTSCLLFALLTALFL